MKKLSNLHLTQKLAIAIPLLSILSYLAKRYVETFRFSDEFRSIYEYGSFGSLMLTLLLIVLSFGNSILIIWVLKIKLLSKILWFLLSLSVFLYFSLAIIFPILRYSL